METLKKVGPYLAIEMLLPGGTLLAALLYLARRRNFSGTLSNWRRAGRLWA